MKTIRGLEEGTGKYESALRGIMRRYDFNVNDLAYMIADRMSKDEIKKLQIKATIPMEYDKYRVFEGEIKGEFQDKIGRD